MASIILHNVGSAIGNAILPGIGGAFLGALGRTAGSYIDGAIGLGTSAQGPQLQNLGVQDSRYGAGIPIVYGNARIAGNVIWSTDLIQTTHTQDVGGKGGGGETVETYTYSVHCAVGICAGPIGGIATIWADSKVIYQDGVWADGILSGASIYFGSAAQDPDGFTESFLGSGNVPAYRGLAYLVMESLQLSNFGNRLPNLTFEILPAPGSANPEWLGNVDAMVDMRPQTAMSSSMPPIAIAGSGGAARRVLAGGYSSPGASCTFTAIEYDVSGDVPLEIARTQSGTFTSTDPADHSWAMAPDKRYVAMYLQDGLPPSHRFAIYDTATRSFGTVLSLAMGSSTTTKSLAWIDPQHFVIDQVVGGQRGVQVFARAGMDVVDLGFFSVWGPSSSTSRQPGGYAQFTPLSGGLVNYMVNGAAGAFSAMYARMLTWKSGTLAVGAEYLLASGLTPGTASAPVANFTHLGNGEWVFCYSTQLYYDLMSFVPGTASATITRPWQKFLLSFVQGSTAQPLLYGNRLVLAQAGVFDATYRLSEISLDNGSFSLAVDGVAISDSVLPFASFGSFRIDGSRLIIFGVAGVDWEMSAFGIAKRRDTGDRLDVIVTDILARAGYESADYDVSVLADTVVDGYIVQEPMTARAALQPLQVYEPFDLVESGDVLKAVLHGGDADLAIPSTEWRAGPDRKAPPPPQEIVRAQELDLPAEVDIDYIDAARDFEVNCQRARRIAGTARAVQKIALPIVCDGSTAKQIAETRLYTGWAERELIKLRISRRYIAADPADVADLGNGTQMRITSVNQAGGLIEAQGFLVYSAANSSAATADGGQTVDRNSVTPVMSLLYLMDLPLLRSADNQPGLYAAVTGLPGWTGASLWRAADGVNFGNVISIATPANAGIATTALADAEPYYMDGANSVNVQLVQGSLSSCSESDLLNGANAALLGNEIIQFQTATLIGDGLYTLSNLLRGRRATESATSTHALGENFVLLTAGAVDFLPALLTDRGRNYDFRALSKGQSLGDAPDSQFTYGLATLASFAPAHVKGARASGTGSDLAITWVRRARLNADWVDYIDVPLDEDEELYDLDIMNGTSVVRTYSALTAPTATYTAAEQIADWGTAPASYTMNVYQIGSRYGRGNVAVAEV